MEPTPSVCCTSSTDQCAECLDLLLSTLFHESVSYGGRFESLGNSKDKIIKCCFSLKKIKKIILKSHSTLILRLPLVK